MRLIRTSIISLIIFSIPTLILAQETPKRSPDLQVLDRFVGTWEHEVTIKTPDGVTNAKGVDTRKWSAGGTYVVFENSLDTKKNKGIGEFHMMTTFDPNSKTYPAIFMSGAFHLIQKGKWDEKTATMHWSGKDSNGNRVTGKHRFIGKDRAEASSVTMNSDGKAVLEFTWKQTRRNK